MQVIDVFEKCAIFGASLYCASVFFFVFVPYIIDGLEWLVRKISKAVKEKRKAS